MFLTVSRAAPLLPARSPGPVHPRAGLWGPKAAGLCPSLRLLLCPAALLPLLALSLGRLWVVEQIGAVAHRCGRGLWSRCCLARAGGILVKSCVRGISPEVFFLLQSVFPVLQNSDISFRCCRPADCYKLLIFSIDYASLFILPLPMTVFPWEAVPAGAHSLVLSILPCTGRFPSVKPFLPSLAAVTIFLCSLFCGYSLSAVPSSEKENPQISHDKSLVAAKSYQKQSGCAVAPGCKDKFLSMGPPTTPCVSQPCPWLPLMGFACHGMQQFMAECFSNEGPCLQQLLKQLGL